MAKKFTISTVFTAVDKITGPIDKISSKVSAAGKKVGDFSRKISGGVAAIAKTGAAVGAAAGGAAIGIFKLTEKIANSGDEIAKTSKMLGMSADAFQKFRYVGERSGVAVSEMDEALKKLTINLGKGSTTTIESLARLGISVDSIRSAAPDDVLNLVAEGFKNLKSPSEKAAIAVDIFGKSGARMVNVLSEGRSGIAALGDEAQRVGYVLGDDVLKNSEALNDKILNMKTSFSAIGVSLAAKFMPIVSDAVDGMTEFFIKNKSFLDKFSNSLVSSLRAVGPLMGEVGKSSANILAPLMDGISRLMVMIAPLIGVIMTNIEAWIAPIMEIFDELVDTFSPVLDMFVITGRVAGSIITATLKAVAALAKVVGFLFKMSFKWALIFVKIGGSIFQPIFEGLGKIFGAIGAAFGAAVKFIKDLGKGILSFFIDIARQVAEPFISAFRVIGDFIGSIFTGVVDAVKKGIEFVIGLLKPVLDVVSKLGGFFSGVFGGDKKSIPSASSTPISSAATTASRVEARSVVDVNFSNPPAGMSAKGSSKTPNLSLNLGFVGR